MQMPKGEQMARLESDLKMGFYPTSIKTLEKITSKIILTNELNDRGIKLLDPCCGEAEALNYLGNFFKAKTFGIELDAERSKVAFDRCDILINNDALNVVKSNGAFELIFLNPPYGNIITNSGNSRLEKEFVSKYAPSLMIGGYMLLVIGEGSLINKDRSDFISALIKSGMNVELVFFDPLNEDYKNYKQYFILLKRKRTDKNKRVTQEEIDKFFNIINIQNAVELDTIESIELTINKSSITNPIFRVHGGLEVWQLEKMMTKQKDKILKSFTNYLGQDALNLTSRSIDAPNNGQATILMMAGLVENPIGGMLIKGMSKKVLNTSKEEDKEVSSEQYVGELYGFDVNIGKYVKFS